MFRVGVLLVVAVAAALSGCGGSDETSSADSGRLLTLHGVAPVSEAFDADEGHARLVLLLSPT